MMMLEKHLARQGSARVPGVLPIAFLLALLALLAWPTMADVLVMKDGSRVETKGTWEVKGRQVLFTLPNGTLSAVRLSEVDLDASAVATEVAMQPVETLDPAAATERPAPVLVLTNKDVAAAAVDPGTPDEIVEEAGSGTGVVVAEWSYDQGGIDPVFILTGRLENQSGQVAENIQLYVDFIAVDGGTAQPDVHFLREANVEQTRLEPNESTDFRYGISRRDLEYSKAPDQFESPRVTFDVQFRTQRPVRGEDDDEGEDEDEDGDDDDARAEVGDAIDVRP